MARFIQSLATRKHLAAQRKIKSLAALVPIVRQASAAGRKVAFTNGCFDLLHAGHVKLLERAKRFGDLLIVGINSDRSVRALKGARRPLVAQDDRALLLAALESVDYVTVFNELTPRRLVARLRPHFLIKGADWAASEIIGRETVRRAGGRVIQIPLLKGYSTSRLIERIQTR
jgi:D-beta-D-heptose 7-phosphate kinase/D-beta-D-heptose 1-phosphate adenosyltransferase